MTTSKTAVHVLIVDDEPLMAWSLADTLNACGDVVEQVGTGAAAIRALEKTSDTVDIVLLDYHLPDSRDLRLLDRVKRLAPHSAVILMSAVFPDDVAEDALARGACCVLRKPMDMTDVPDLVHAAAACARNAATRPPAMAATAPATSR